MTLKLHSIRWIPFSVCVCVFFILSIILKCFGTNDKRNGQMIKCFHSIEDNSFIHVDNGLKWMLMIPKAGWRNTRWYSVCTRYTYQSNASTSATFFSYLSFVSQNYITNLEMFDGFFFLFSSSFSSFYPSNIFNQWSFYVIELACFCFYFYFCAIKYEFFYMAS